MNIHHFSRQSYVRLSSNASARSGKHAPTSSDTYAARFKAMIAPITQMGSFATLAALHLPFAAASARDAFEDLRGGKEPDNGFAGPCLKGLAFGLTAPVALGLAAAFVLVTLGAYAVCVPYAALRSLPGMGAQSTALADADDCGDA